MQDPNDIIKCISQNNFKYFLYQAVELVTKKKLSAMSVKAANVLSA